MTSGPATAGGGCHGQAASFGRGCASGAPEIGWGGLHLCQFRHGFPPIIEGLAEATAKDMPLPHALTIPHEHAAMGMAHGYYLATGRAQAVIAHTDVGLANCAIGALNAHVENVPILLFSGRTPTVEKGRFGARTVPIGWGQEMRDQSSLVREASKWDYELRFPEQVPDVVDRAHAIASSTPKGPVYVSLPAKCCANPARPKGWTCRRACARMGHMPLLMKLPNLRA